MPICFTSAGFEFSKPSPEMTTLRTDFTELGVKNFTLGLEFSGLGLENPKPGLVTPKAGQKNKEVGPGCSLLPFAISKVSIQTRNPKSTMIELTI